MVFIICIVCCSRSQDVHMPDYPLLVTMEFSHNHPLNTASVLRHRDVAQYVSAKFAELLSIGHSPLAALAIHKYDLYLEHGAHLYLNFVNDRHHFPDVGWCYRYEFKAHIQHTFVICSQYYLYCFLNCCYYTICICIFLLFCAELLCSSDLRFLALLMCTTLDLLLSAIE